MKHTVHVTLVASVEVEAATRAEAMALALAQCEVVGGNQFDESAEIFESYRDEPRKPRVGRGSY